MIKIVCWNVAGLKRPWQQLAEMDADVALLQEARTSHLQAQEETPKKPGQLHSRRIQEPAPRAESSYSRLATSRTPPLDSMPADRARLLFPLNPLGNGRSAKPTVSSGHTHDSTEVAAHNRTPAALSDLRTPQAGAAWPKRYSPKLRVHQNRS